MITIVTYICTRSRITIRIRHNSTIDHPPHIHDTIDRRIEGIRRDHGRIATTVTNGTINHLYVVSFD